MGQRTKYISLLGPMPWTTSRIHRVYTPPLSLPHRRVRPMTWRGRAAVALFITAWVMSAVLAIVLITGTVVLTVRAIAWVAERAALP